MKMMTKTLATKFEKIGNQEQEVDPIVVARYFLVSGKAQWLATEYFPDRNECFGYVKDLAMQGGEYGYFSLTEMSEIQHPQLKIPAIERDLYYSGDQRISTLCPELADEIKRRQELQEVQSNKEQTHTNDLER